DDTTRLASDIVRRLRQTRADMIGTDDEQHYWDCHDAAAEIERLRLTDAERQKFRTALADAIRRPMGVIPQSAEGLVTQDDLDAAEGRRTK
ncbi:MAG: hypothetical protein EBS90_13770, partial [Betaproteobacteria bacterium]|nr:hypothetical protein [Betaproteobacteria bacterium]